MGIAKDLVDLAEKAINEHGSAQLQKERVEYLRERINDTVVPLEKKNIELEKENIELKEQILKLTQEKDSLAEKQQYENNYVRFRGVYFEKKKSGGYRSDAVYCPKCKGPMFSMQNMTEFHCNQCHVTANFTGRQLKQGNIIKELEEEYPNPAQ
jgi:ATP-dependent protease HslVU (ClpYQ) ATPase subunit